MSTAKNDNGIEKVDGNTIHINDAEKFGKHLAKVTDRLTNKKAVKEPYDFMYKFSDVELQEIAKQLAKACQERNELEDQKKSITSDFKAKIDSKVAQVNILTGHINNGYEYLTKSCDVVMDFDKGVKRYYYEGLEVGTVKLKASDYQIKAELDAEAAAEGAE